MTRQAACTHGACAFASAKLAVSVLLDGSLSNSRTPGRSLAVLESDGNRPAACVPSVLQRRSMHTTFRALNLAR